MPAFNVALTSDWYFHDTFFFCPVVLIILYHYGFSVSFSVKIITVFFKFSLICLYFFFEYLFILLYWVLVMANGLSCTMCIGS